MTETLVTDGTGGGGVVEQALKKTAAKVIMARRLSLLIRNGWGDVKAMRHGNEEAPSRMVKLDT